MAKKVLMVLTSRALLNDDKTAAGSWLEELAAPYYTFLDAGVEPVLASVKGGAAPVDPASLEAPWLTPFGERFLADKKAQADMAATVSLSQVNAADFDGMFLVGGAAVMWDFPHDAALGGLIDAMHGEGRLVSGVCHGVAGLLNEHVKSKFLDGRQLTCISDNEDKLAGYDQLVPFMPESRFRAAGAQMSFAAEPFGCHAVRDGTVVTGQNPASAQRCAELGLEVLVGAEAPELSTAGR